MSWLTFMIDLMWNIAGFCGTLILSLAMIAVAIVVVYAFIGLMSGLFASGDEQ